VEDCASRTSLGTIVTRLNYIAPMAERARYHAFNSARDVIKRDRRRIRIENARLLERAPTLAREGFELVSHTTGISDLSSQEELAHLYPREIERLVKDVTGADQVIVSGRGVLRFSQPTTQVPARLHVLRPARFIHMDVSESTAADLMERWLPTVGGRSIRRCAHYNVWRVLTPPPQDVPLALCDALSVCASDLVDVDSIADPPGEPESSLVVVMVRYNPEHRWWYFPDMTPDEVLIFKSHDSDPEQPQRVPHSAFRNPGCPPGVAPRASIDIRTMAFWFTD